MKQVLSINRSLALSGTVRAHGAKNAVLPLLASLLLTRGKSVLTNVPFSTDTYAMLNLLRILGAHVQTILDEHMIIVDTSSISSWHVPIDVMQQMRASILVLGPLLSRFGKAEVALPGGCVIGKRAIDFHLNGLSLLGACINQDHDTLQVNVNKLVGNQIVFDYPSVGATENILMAAVCASGITSIVNASLEPEVMDLIIALRKMGASIKIEAPATITISGVDTLNAIEHRVVSDRLEVGTVLCAAAITGSRIVVTHAQADTMTIVLEKLRMMGHEIIVSEDHSTITFNGTDKPQSVSFKTGPYPSFPTDLQAPMMALQTVAYGRSIVEETVFENRFLHVRELQKMGAHICVDGNRATVVGVDHLYGSRVIASDIRASAALAIAGMVAHGNTTITGVHHWKRGYDSLDVILRSLGAQIMCINEKEVMSQRGTPTSMHEDYK